MDTMGENSAARVNIIGIHTLSAYLYDVAVDLIVWY